MKGARAFSLSIALAACCGAAVIGCGTPDLDATPPWPATCDVDHHTYDYRNQAAANAELGVLVDGAFTPLTATTKVEESIDPWGSYSQWIVFFAIRVTLDGVTAPTVCANVDSLAQRANDRRDGVVLSRVGDAYVTPAMPYPLDRSTGSHAISPEGSQITISTGITALAPEGDFGTATLEGVATVVNAIGYRSKYEGGAAGATGTTGAAGSGGAAGSSPPAGCNAVANVGPTVDQVTDAGPAPAMTGGTIADGTYVTTAATRYNTASGLPTSFKETWVFAAGTLKAVLQQSTISPATFTGTTVAAGSTLTITYSCPQAVTVPVGYTATPTQIQLLVNGSDLRVLTKK